MHSTCHGALPAVSAVLDRTLSVRAFLRRQGGDLVHSRSGYFIGLYCFLFGKDILNLGIYKLK